MSIPASSVGRCLKNRGFTLLEILVVLVLMVLAAGFIAPAMLNSGVAQMRSATRIVAAGLQRSREYAINQQLHAAMVVDVNQRRFTVPGQPKARQLAADITLKVFTARSELLDEARAGIRFFPDGSSSGGRISLSQGSHSAYVDVDWLTGRILTYAGPPGNTPKRLANRVHLPTPEDS